MREEEIAPERWNFLAHEDRARVQGYVSTAQAATATETRTSSTVELRGDVLEVLQALLAEGRSNEVVALVTKLVLAQQRAWRNETGAGTVGRAKERGRVECAAQALPGIAGEAERRGRGRARGPRLRTRSCATARASTRRKRSRRSRRSSRRCASRRRRICAASRISFWCRPGNGAARNAARSAIASGTRWTEVIELIPAGGGRAGGQEGEAGVPAVRRGAGAGAVWGQGGQRREAGAGPGCGIAGGQVRRRPAPASAEAAASSAWDWCCRYPHWRTR